MKIVCSFDFFIGFGVRFIQDEEGKLVVINLPFLAIGIYQKTRIEEYSGEDEIEMRRRF